MYKDAREASSSFKLQAPRFLPFGLGFVAFVNTKYLNRLFILYATLEVANTRNKSKLTYSITNK
jgi:hypothetical protein